MKKISIFILLLFVLLGMGACYEDKSSLGGIEVSDIKINDLQDVSIVSFSDNILHIEPIVESGYPEEEMRYAWYIHGGIFDDDSRIDGGFRTNLISETKVLDYEINLPSGIYRLIFEAIAPNGYSQWKEMHVTASTPFSQGFYLLKETVDGNTEVDLLMTDGLNENLMEKAIGEPMPGKPVGMTVVYNNGYINEETQDLDAANILHVISENDYRGFRTEDLVQIFDLSNLTYDGPLPNGEQPASIIQYSSGAALMTDGGIYTTSTAIMGTETSGKFGVNIYPSGSKYIFAMEGGMTGVSFWGENTHRVYDNLSDEPEPLDWELPEGVDANNLSCIASGLNTYLGLETGWFLLKDNTSSKRYLVLLGTEKIGYYDYACIIEVREIPAESHLAKGNLFAGCGLQAPVIYVVDNNLLYTYDINSKLETQIPLPGLSGGTITYIGNNYMNDNYGDESGNFDYLLLATNDGGNYTLHFYDELVSGAPKNAPFQTIEGIGTIKGVRYLSLSFDGEAWMYVSNPWIGSNGPCYPFEM